MVVDGLVYHKLRHEYTEHMIIVLSIRSGLLPTVSVCCIMALVKMDILGVTLGRWPCELVLIFTVHESHHLLDAILHSRPSKLWILGVVYSN